MGIQLVGWSESVPATTTQQNITAILDDSVRTEGDNIVVPKLNKIIGEYAIGVDIQNVELASPSLRQTFLESITPVENTAAPVYPPDPLIRYKNPLPVQTDEQLTALCGNSNVAAKQETVFVWLSEGPVTPVVGSIYTIEGSVTVPATSYAWANAQITLLQSLPSGNYKVVGGRMELSTLVAWRLNFVGGIWRPGTLGVASISSADPKGARYGEMGVWGSFEHLIPPTVDCFDTGAGGTATIYLDLIKI